MSTMTVTDEEGRVLFESIDAAAQEAVERANGGPVSGGAVIDLDREAALRAAGIVRFDPRACMDVARTISLRQAAGETPGQFVQRITLAVLDELGGVA